MMKENYNLDGKTVLVTGATGFIGRNLIKSLLKERTIVRAFVRDVKKARSLMDQKVEIFEGDMQDHISIKRALRGVNAVFHCAGVLGSEFKPIDYFRAVNVDGTRVLAEMAVEENVERFVHTSTVWVYGMNASKNTNEEYTRIMSNDYYTDTKVEAENIIFELVKNKGLKAIIVQPSQVYGPEDETWTLGPIKLMKSYMMILPGKGKGIIQPIFIDDLVESIICAIKRGRVGEEYLLCGNEIVTIREFFGYYKKIIGRNWIPSIPKSVALTLAHIYKIIASIVKSEPIFTVCEVRGTTMGATYDCTKAKRELGFEAKVNLEVGMEKLKQWINESPEVL